MSDGASKSELAGLVDHTLLAADASALAIEQLCLEAIELGCYSVCVNSSRLPMALSYISGSSVVGCAVIGFPLGAATTQAKHDEAAWCVAEGAAEIDMVMNLGWFADGDLETVSTDIEVVKAACGPGVGLKVILESALWTPEQLASACEVAVSAGADFVKTSTGFHAAGGASVEAVSAMRAAVGPSVGVKASGGIRDLAAMRAMLAAGATRLGMSNTATALAAL